jgi:hypothetical protein
MERADFVSADRTEDLQQALVYVEVATPWELCLSLLLILAFIPISMLAGAASRQRLVTWERIPVNVNLSAAEPNALRFEVQGSAAADSVELYLTTKSTRNIEMKAVATIN